jgi:exopolyphosphatase / guanosine-5'-triphosphate,3'-diphosphate pyrophosphatase
VTPADRRVAVVDIGSNSTRLFLCTGWGPGGPEGERRTTITALRRGAAPDGSIAPEALARLDDCLRGYAERIAAFAPGGVAPVATSAVRDAPNREEVAAVVRARLGVAPRVLSGDEEARVAFAGARLGVPDDAGVVMVVDIGGASTELVRGGPGGPDGAVSLQLGGTRQTERHLHHDPPRPEEVAALLDDAGALVDGGLSAIGGPAPAVGVAGTVTSLAATEIGYYDPDAVQGHVLTREAVVATGEKLCEMTVAERARIPGLEPARAPIIAGACLIVRAVLERAGLDAMRVSERDLLDGVAMLHLPRS